ncbi:MAG: sigma-70 family RNA polymerase sigma factor [Acidobacteria bacterium]|nr:sigma-70 family RNA polymerase sigma factor [Acidobacteriota bacterium]
MAAGDPAAATAFVRRHQQRVYGIALAVTGDRHLANDVAQEAFVRAWRAAATFDSRRGSASSWLLVIARNLAVDALRVRRGTPTDPRALAALALAAADPSPDDRAVGADESDRLRIALQTVPVDQRRAVVLAGIGGMTGQEDDDHEGIPLGTAKTRIRAGLRRLRDELREEVG